MMETYTTTVIPLSSGAQNTAAIFLDARMLWYRFQESTSSEMNSRLVILPFISCYLQNNAHTHIQYIYIYIYAQYIHTKLKNNSHYWSMKTARPSCYLFVSQNQYVKFLNVCSTIGSLLNLNYTQSSSQGPLLLFNVFCLFNVRLRGEVIIRSTAGFKGLYAHTDAQVLKAWCKHFTQTQHTRGWERGDYCVCVRVSHKDDSFCTRSWPGLLRWAVLLFLLCYTVQWVIS